MLGVPWWGAILIAVGTTLAGFAIDVGSGHQELTVIFAALYFIGCVLAVLAVRRSGIFTAVVQPPLILFVAVPTAYYLFHRNEIKGIKDVLINCGYPLIERFLTMFVTSVVVLLIGMARWYFGSAGRATTATADESGGATATRTAARPLALFAGIGAAFAAPFRRRSREGEDRAAPPRRRSHAHAVSRGSATKSARERRAATDAPSARSRRTRRPLDAPDAAPAQRRRGAGRSRAHDEASEPPPRRRRAPRESDPRDLPRDYRGREDPADWARDAPARPRRPSRYANAYDNPYDNAYDPHQPYEPYESYGEHSRRDPYPPPPASSRHPFSNVRYRGSGGDEGGDKGGDKDGDKGGHKDGDYDYDRPYRRPR